MKHKALLANAATIVRRSQGPKKLHSVAKVSLYFNLNSKTLMGKALSPSRFVLLSFHHKSRFQSVSVTSWIWIWIWAIAYLFPDSCSQSVSPLVQLSFPIMYSCVCCSHYSLPCVVQRGSSFQFISDRGRKELILADNMLTDMLFHLKTYL